jgi:hypothetical protein
VDLQLTPEADGGSILIENGTGSIPGLEGGLNPILDASGRSYIYARNIAVNGGQTQPVSFRVGQPLQLTDRSGSSFEIRVIAMLGRSFLIDYRKVAGPAAGTPVQVQLLDSAGNPVADADALLVSSDGRAFPGRSQANGTVSLTYFGSQRATLYCAKAGFEAYVGPNRAPRSDTVTLASLPGGGSIVIEDGVGSIPGLDGSLNPILDSLGRSYMYLDGITVSGGQTQPVSFTVGQPLRVYDAAGHEFSITVLAMNGRSFLIEYKRP